MRTECRPVDRKRHAIDMEMIALMYGDQYCLYCGAEVSKGIYAIDEVGVFCSKACMYAQNHITEVEYEL